MSNSQGSATRPAAARILVLGGTGGTGRAIVAQALARGHDVTVLARSPE
ncbi:NAD(P)H-binding protein, partial [Acinetobacter baumannii]